MPTTTILFTDLVNSTDLLTSLGDRRARQLFNDHYQSVRSAVEAFHGKVIKWQGDGVMARFDSAWDALRAAVASQHAADKMPLGHRIGMRTGVHVGDTLTWDESDLFGMPVVVARRLCEQASSGQILCSSTVVELLPGGHGLQMQEVGLTRLKGVDYPVAVFVLHWQSSNTGHDWTEDESELFLQLADVAIPARDQQIATIISLLPFDQNDRFNVLELGAGQGALAYAILDCYPNARITALDGSQKMRALAANCLRPFGDRCTVAQFELGSTDWWPTIATSEILVSSLLIHHLPDAQKQRLFEDVYDRLLEPGAVLIADITKAERPEQRRLLADNYDAVVLEQSLARMGSDEGFQVFRERNWNIFQSDSLPPDEEPASLLDSLNWLRSAGFEGVDCFWMRTGFAVFGGFKGKSRATSGIGLESATEAARRALNVAAILK